MCARNLYYKDMDYVQITERVKVIYCDEGEDEAQVIAWEDLTEAFIRKLIIQIQDYIEGK